MDDKKRLGIAAGAGAGMTAGVSILADLQYHHIATILSETVHDQVVQAGIFFTLAAWMHSGRVRKEIAKNFSALTEAIEKVSQTLRQDLDQHAKILNEYGRRLKTVETKMSISPDKGGVNVRGE